MRVVHINLTARQGGTGSVVYGISQVLRQNNYESYTLFSTNEKKTENELRYSKTSRRKANALISAKKLEAYANNKLNRPNTQEKKEYLKYQIDYAKYRQEKLSSWLNGLVGWFCNCLSTDINSANENQKSLINECIDNDNLENFEIPNITK